MKGKLIVANWLLSFVGLSIDTERSPLWASMLMVAWFCVATLLLKYAERKGWMKQFEKLLNTD